VIFQFSEAVAKDPYFAVKGFTVESFKSYHMQTDMNEAERAAFEDLIREPGFCLSLERYVGAFEAVQTLRNSGRFQPVALTAPLADSYTWVAERITALSPVFSPKDIIFCPSKHKHLVNGAALVEDSVENLEAWLNAHPYGLGFLVTRPWNAGSDLPERYVPRGTGLLKGGCYRVSSLKEAVARLLAQ
jgi:5'(3')-deoxyribonucleotidase